jgi:methyl-accepting chemotaxis protein
MNISLKLPSVIIGIGVAGALAVGVAGYLTAARTVEQVTQARLSAIADAQGRAAATWLDGLAHSAASTAASKSAMAAMMELRKAWDGLGPEAAATLSAAYVSGNTKADKAELESAGRSLYDKAHKTWHPLLRGMREEMGVGDILLVAPDGTVVYSVGKRPDFAGNLADGPLAGGGAGKAFAAAMALQEKGAVMTPFAAYEAAGGEPAAFVAAPIRIGKKSVGVVLIEAGADGLDGILGRFSGLGETGDVFLVHENGLVQNESTRTPDATERLTPVVAGALVEAALAGSAGYGELPEFRGTPHVAATVPVAALGQRFAVVAVQDRAEVKAPLASLRAWLIGIAVAIAATSGLVGWLFSRRLTGRLANLQSTMKELAAGRLDVEVPADRVNDEITAMAGAVRVFRENGIERERLARAQEASRAADERRASAVAMAVQEFRSTVTASLEAVARDAATMLGTADALATGADVASADAGRAASGSDHASRNVESVAAASQEMVASMAEISRLVTATSHTVETAALNAATADEKIAALAGAADRIGDVVKLISDIAGQTNLLALNATIEAARAGEAGRGFAVVASEVKALASQTSKATEEIAAQIQAIQESTGEAVSVIRAITEVMATVNGNTTSIAAAVEEQGSASEEITRSIVDASAGARSSATAIAEVEAAIRRTADSAGLVGEASTSVSTQTGRIRDAVTGFLSAVEAA